MGYNDKLDADAQIDAEEEIAGLIFGARDEENGLCEDICGALGRQILMVVLAEFRPDLFDDDGHRPDAGVTACKYCGEKPCDYSCDESQAGGFGD